MKSNQEKNIFIYKKVSEMNPSYLRKKLPDLMESNSDLNELKKYIKIEVEQSYPFSASLDYKGKKHSKSSRICLNTAIRELLLSLD